MPLGLAGGWQPAGTSATRGAQRRAELREVEAPQQFEMQTSAVRQAADQVRGPVGAPQVGGHDDFDPFEPLNDQDAAMPAAEPTPADAQAPNVADQFDPFENDDATETAAPADDRDNALGRPGSPRDADRSVGSPRDADEKFDVQEAFGNPRDNSVGPQVEDQLDAADDAIEEELDRREDEGPTTPADDGNDPFSPADAMDAPERRVEESFSEPETDESETEESDDQDDIGSRFQQAPGGFDFRPLNQQQQQREMTPQEQEEHRQQLERERLESAETCEEFLAQVRADNIRTVSLDIRMHGVAGEDYPFDCGLGDELFQPRTWSQVTYMWKASGLYSKPLYFEQVQMERYGHSWGPILDPIVSGAHFFGTVPILPYKMGLQTPNECVYTLGYYRPGSCAPYMISPLGFTWRAAAFEAGAWTGGAFAIP